MTIVMGAAMDGGGEHVTIPGIRQNETLDPVLKAGDRGVRHMPFHQTSRGIDLIGLKIGSVPPQRGAPFVLHLRRPMRLKQTVQGQTHEDVAQQRGIENARIEKRDTRFLHRSPSV